MDRTFSRDDTKLMKGAAIVLMLMQAVSCGMC